MTDDTMTMVDDDDDVEEEEEEAERKDATDMEISKPKPPIVQQQQQQIQAATPQLQKHMGKFIRILQWASNDKVHALLLLLAMILYHVILVPVFLFATDKQNHSIQERCTSMVLVSNYVFGVLVLGMIACMIVIVAVDMMANVRHLCCCQWRQVFVHDDPMMFRIEYALLFAAVAVYFVIAIALYLVRSMHVALVHTLVDCNMQLLYLVLLFICPGVPMFATMHSDLQQFNLSQRLAKPMDATSTIDITRYNPCKEVLEHLLTHAESKRLLILFCMKEYSVENVLFWVFVNIQFLLFCFRKKWSNLKRLTKNAN